MKGLLKRWSFWCLLVLAALALRDSGAVDNLVELVVADPTTGSLTLCPRTTGPRSPTTWAVVEHGETVLL